ncbi:hypothetical protein LCGC14_2756560 [marine sediment metagenome]|uniref:GH16 domain-containing protein n=1 Tax=marine sediment metagenome TaxID=412755 RepID=A0A0F8ZM35_9ZZZZ
MSRVKHNALHQYTAGLNNAPASTPAANLPFTHPVFQGWKVYYWGMNDGETRADDVYWTPLAIASGGIGAGNENGLQITNNSTDDNSGYLLTPNLVDLELTSDSKKFYMETRIMVTAANINQIEWFIGLGLIVQGPQADGAAWTNDEMLGFGHLDADTVISFLSIEDDGQQIISLGSELTTATYTKLSCYFDGTNFNVYLDDVLKGSTPMVYLNADEPWTANFFMKSGYSTEAQSLDIQYLLFAAEL